MIISSAKNGIVKITVKITAKCLTVKIKHELSKMKELPAS